MPAETVVAGGGDDGAGGGVDGVGLEVEVVGRGVEVAAGAGARIKVTGTACGLLMASTPTIVMVVEYVPAARPARFALAAKAVGESPDVPEEGESASHDAVALALQSNAPLPVFEISTVCSGLVSPCATENARFVGFRLIAGLAPL
jgi:hypothetical protein